MIRLVSVYCVHYVHDIVFEPRPNISQLNNNNNNNYEGRNEHVVDRLNTENTGAIFVADRYRF